MAFEYKNMTDDGIAVVRTIEPVGNISESQYEQQTEDIKTFLSSKHGGEWECAASEINIDGTESSGWKRQPNESA